MFRGILSWLSPLMKYTVILNPMAHHGKAGRQRGRLETIFSSSGHNVRWLRTGKQGDAEAMAREAAESSDAVIAVGGDGTVHEVCCGLISCGGQTPFGVIPCGTGNDFASMIGMPTRPKDAALALFAARPQSIDYGRVRWRQDGAWFERPFVNAVGFGFDAAVAMRVERYKQLPGLLAYLTAIIHTLKHRQAVEMRIVASGTGSRSRDIYSGKTLLAAAGNGNRSGGGFLMTPDASLTDGQLDLCVAEEMPMHRIIRVLPMALSGTHARAREITLYRSRGFQASTDLPLPLHVDGEVLTIGTSEIDVCVVPNGLTVMIPQQVHND